MDTDYISLLDELDDMLINLLEDLTSEEWNRQTIVPLWSVKDIATHLLDGNLRSLSMLRDGYFSENPKVNSYRELVNYLNGLNADWVKATKRLSPEVLLTWLQQSGREYRDHLKSLPPDAQATFSVAWAGESVSTNSFHIAREYTEKWHHQQQIRLVTGETEKLYQDRYYVPYLDTSMRALPYHYRNVPGNPGETLKITVFGQSEKSWLLSYSNHWEVVEKKEETQDSEVRIPDEYAWRIFTKGLSAEEAQKVCKISGNITLGKHLFSMLAVMASY
ncbi:MAG: maleylpyruvate isomerase N-terminal domain-containing protein [Saprospiraceae bacterium]|nr:maleylpyruvate isomerase N-terminal domain-containing protein [Saprospiraceae bacterium]